MALKIRGPRATAAACAAVTAVVLAVGAALPATAAGYPASAGPWGSAAGLTGADGEQSLIDVQVAGDGTAFALWRNKAAGAATWDIQAVVRPAGSDTWAAPHTLFTTANATAPAVLTVTADGHAEVAWMTGTYTDGSLAAVSAGWDPATGTWSDPSTLTAYAGLDLSMPQLAAAADGTVTAVWVQGDAFWNSEAMTATLAPGATAWSAPHRLGSFSDGFIEQFSLAVAPDGAATTVWDAWDRTSDSNVDSIVTRATPGGDWSSPVALPGADAKSSDVQVSMSAKGATTVLWQHATNGVETLKSLSRPSPTGSWGVVQTAAPIVQDNDDSGPLTAPNGDVTYVWAGWTGSAGMPIVQAVTRSASTGTWSAPKTLSTGYADPQMDASIGADGTVQVVWPQAPGIDNGEDHYLEWAVRTGGTWSKATALTTTPVASVPDMYALTAEVAAGPDGRATVLGRTAVHAPGSADRYTSQVWSRSQTLLTKPTITKKATVSGTARTGSKVTCSAAWSGYNATGAWSWSRDGRTISAATGTTRTLTSDDYTHKIACEVTVGNGAGSVDSTSPAVTVAVGPAAKATKAPSLSGTAEVGYRLTAAHGTWAPTATSYAYSWKRDGKVITGATKSTYVVVKADKGQKITVGVTAHRYGWSAGSATTASVTVR
ncbi:hypothetical protein [Streptomyces sp. NBC_00343]|uniref:hypothetical protein n=1 Tax=Streptomyces sp. NBC_00343 TaxID=2975719 RepID=UPI002E28008D|nr:hypothetical protein [Streptomyces sp. NBC_00343]